MPLYFFRISHGRYSGASDQGSEFESREAAWAEMTKVCANLVGGISRSLKQDAEWRMELLDEVQEARVQDPAGVGIVGLDRPGSACSRHRRGGQFKLLHSASGFVSGREITRSAPTRCAKLSAKIVDVQRGASETGSASTQVLSAARSLSGDSNRLKLEVGKFLNTVRAA